MRTSKAQKIERLKAEVKRVQALHEDLEVKTAPKWGFLIQEKSNGFHWTIYAKGWYYCPDHVLATGVAKTHIKAELAARHRLVPFQMGSGPITKKEF